MAGRATEKGKTIQYIRLKPVTSEEVKEILIGVNMNTMLLDNYTQFGNNGSNNIFTVDTYQVNKALDASMFDINSAEFSGYYRL